MTGEKLYELLGDLNEEHVQEARAYRGANRAIWRKWGAAAACLLLVLGTVVTSLAQQETPQELHTGAYLQFVRVELVAWQDDGFQAVVVETGNSSIFPVGAKLSVLFRENNTEIVLEDGTSYGYGEISIDSIPWSEGAIIDVGFAVYESYSEERGYDNKLYAYHLEPFS